MTVESTIKPSTAHRKDRRHYGILRELSITYEGYSENVYLRPPDLSAQGMFIQTARHFPEGTVLKVRFRLAHSGVEVKVRSEVRYCLSGVGIGVEFIDISPEARLAIEKELRGSEPASPEQKRP